MTRLLVLALTLTWLTGCVASHAPATPIPPEERDWPPMQLSFVTPEEGAITGSPVRVVGRAENLILERAGQVRRHAGHFHLIVDAPCIPAGQPIPQDARHHHLDLGQIELAVEMEPGEHTLCLQAADGAQIALPGPGATVTRTITVR